MDKERSERRLQTKMNRPGNRWENVAVDGAEYWSDEELRLWVCEENRKAKVKGDPFRYRSVLNEYSQG